MPNPSPVLLVVPALLLGAMAMAPALGAQSDLAEADLTGSDRPRWDRPQSALVESGPNHVEREAWAMGTRVTVVVEGVERVRGLDATEQILREIDRYEQLLSSWNPSSSLATLNSAPPGVAVQAEGELLEILAEAWGWSGRTGRAFDPTVGALVDAWDLRGGGRTPDDAEVAAALAATGPRGLTLDPATGGVVRRSGRAWIDTGGFGKGVALRGVRDLLRHGGPTRARVDLGGQLLLLAGGREPYRVGVAHPSRRHEPLLSLILGDASVSTSGGSERPRHILDPRTGRPTPPWGSVTVVHEDPVVADILSTALYVMGPLEGHTWAETEGGIAALFLEEVEGEVRARWTAAMAPFLGPDHPQGPSREAP